MYRIMGPLFHAQSVDRSRRIIIAAKKTLLEYLNRRSWFYQDELIIFLEEEWDITVSQFTISRLLKEEGINRKRG